MTKTAKAFLETFALRNPKAYSPEFKKELALRFGLTIDELGSVCIKVAEAYSLSCPPFSHLPPHEQRIMDMAGALTLGMFMGQEFVKFINPPKGKQN